jgi:hypothetical protein
MEAEMRRTTVLTLAVVALGACLMALSGCFVPAMPAEDNRADMTAEDLVGVWRDSSGTRVLVFEEGGDFAADGLPYEMFDGFRNVLPDSADSKHDQLTGSGWWSLEPSHVDLDGPASYVALHFRKVADRVTSGVIRIRAERAGESIVLAYYVGDPDLDSRIVYERCKADCPSLAPAVQ